MYVSYYEMVQIIHEVEKEYENLTKEHADNRHYKKVHSHAKVVLRKVEKQTIELMKKKYDLKK